MSLQVLAFAFMFAGYGQPPGRALGPCAGAERNAAAAYWFGEIVGDVKIVEKFVNIAWACWKAHPEPETALPGNT